MLLNKITKALFVSGLCVGLLGGVQASSLKIAFASEPTAIDPHYYQLTPNISAASHIFETLAYFDHKMKLNPVLAESWSLRDDNTWVFKLRHGVKFSNGAPFTSKDVIFTMCRTMFNETSAGGYDDVVKRIVSMTAEDEHTLVIQTDTPYPLLIEDLAGIFMLSSSIVTADHLRFDKKNNCGVTSPWPTVNDFNSGKVTIGTGPYLFKSYTKGGSLELTRNDQYWGGTPEWSDVKIVAIPTAAPRVTALLSGEFDIVENVAGRDLKRVTEKGLAYTRTPSVRVIVLELDSGRPNSPLVSAPNGKNPLQDVRVRQALSMAIDRDNIVSRVLEGAGVPAYQYLPDGMFGALTKAPVLSYNPEAAKKLLAEAGYPNGFELTLTGPNDRYIADSQVLQTIAQYFNKIGIKTKVDTMARSVFFPKRDNLEYSASLMGWASSTGEASNYLRYWVATRDNQSGFGGENVVGFSHPEIDQLIHQAVGTMDNARRASLLQQALGTTLEQLPQIPLHFESSTWAHRSGIVYDGRPDQRTTAMSAHPK